MSDEQKPIPNDDGELPPWLRGADEEPSQPEANETKPVIRRISKSSEPPPPNDDDDDVPPWLRGLDAPAPKTYRIGGAELPEDYFADVESLPESNTSGLTYDQWLAQQIEASRPKDLEEEIPDLLSDAPPDLSAFPSSEVKGGTSQLPDWFLGLQELDQTEVPDWLDLDPEKAVAFQTNILPPLEEPPVNEPPPTAAPTDALDDFFASFGDPPLRNTDSVEEDDFFAAFGAMPNEQSADADEDDVPSADFFNTLISSRSSKTPPSNTFAMPAMDDLFAGSQDDPSARDDESWDDDFGDFEESFNERQPLSPSIVQTGILPDFDPFEMLAREEAQASMPDEDMPDLMATIAGFSEGEDDSIPTPTSATTESADDGETLAWLSELEGIVSSVTHDRPSQANANEQPPDPVLTEDAIDDAFSGMDFADSDDAADGVPSAQPAAQPEASAPRADQAISDDDLYSGWLSDALLDDDAIETDNDTTPSLRDEARPSADAYTTDAAAFASIDDSEMDEETDFLSLLGLEESNISTAEATPVAANVETNEDDEPLFTWDDISPAEATPVAATIETNDDDDEPLFTWDDISAAEATPIAATIETNDDDDEPLFTWDDISAAEATPIAATIETNDDEPSFTWDDVPPAEAAPVAATIETNDDDDESIFDFDMLEEDLLLVEPPTDPESAPSEGLALDDFFASYADGGANDDPQSVAATPLSAAELLFADFEADMPVVPMEDEDDPDWLRNIPPAPIAGGRAGDPPIDPQRASRDDAVFEDVDSYLASLQGEQPEVAPEVSAVFSGMTEYDIEKLFSADLPSMMDTTTGGDEGLEVAQADWLAEIEPSVSEVSASALVRQRDERPEEQLNERLQRLRRMSKEQPSGALRETSDEALDGSDIIAPFTDSDFASAPAVLMTPDQQRRSDLLRVIAGTQAADARRGRMSAMEQTFASPYMPELESDDESIVHKDDTQARTLPVMPTYRPKRRDLPIERFVIVLLLVIALLAPFFVPAFRIGDPPPAAFVRGGEGAQAFTSIDSVRAGSLVLVALDYAPSAFAELDPAVESVMRHLLLKGARPVIISANPVTLIHAESMLARIASDEDFLNSVSSDTPLTADEDYFIDRFLPARAIGLSQLMRDDGAGLVGWLSARGDDLPAIDLPRFDRIVVATDSAETVRIYAEQVVPVAGAPLVAIINYASVPFAMPYVSAWDGGAAGLLVGYQDGLTYETALAAVRPVARASVPSLPTATPPPPAAPSAIEAPDASAIDPEATPEVTDDAGQPVTATPTPEPVLLAVVIANNAANIRTGPGTTNAVLTSVPPNTSLEVIGGNEAGDWVNIRLDDGRTGWIAAALVRIETGTLPIRPKPAPQIIDEEPTRTPRPTNTRGATTATPTETASPTATSTPRAIVTTPAATAISTTTTTPRATATEDAAVEPVVALTPEATTDIAPEDVADTGVTPEEPAPPLRLDTLIALNTHGDARWHAFTFGTLAVTTIIAFGSLINIVRSVLRNRRDKRR